MKAAFGTLACPERSAGEFFDLAERTGIREIEVRLDRENRLFGCAKEEIPALRREMMARGLHIPDLGTGISVDHDRAELLPQIDACASLAAEIGARGIRVFLGNGMSRFSEPVARDTEGVAALLKKGAELAGAYGVEIWLETHSNFSTGASVGEVLERADRPELKVLWDVLHSVEFGETPEKTVKILGDRIVHLHLKDGKRPADPDTVAYRLTRIGEGDLPFGALAEALKHIRYDGLLSLEWEAQWHPELKTLFPSDDALLTDYLSFIKKYFPVEA